MTECPYCGWLERPQVYADGILRCSKCGTPFDDTLVRTYQLGDESFSIDTDVQPCPSCGSPMESGYVVGARGIFWNSQIPREMYSGEQLSDEDPAWAWTFPTLKALRCRKCRIIRY